MRYEGKSPRRYSCLGLLACGYHCTIAWLGAGKGREGKVVPGQTASMENGIYIASSRINEGSLPYCMEA